MSGHLPPGHPQSLVDWAAIGRLRGTVVVTSDQRYPRWSGKAAAETGIRSVLSLQLFTGEGSLGALNLFSPQVDAFDAEDLGEGPAFAAQAAVAVRRAQKEEGLRTAMATRTVIGQAQGILMERLKLTPDQAFAILSKLSQDTNTKLREVARRLAESGEIPVQGSRRGP